MSQPPILRVSNSEIQVWKECRRKWYLTFYRNLQSPEPTTGPLAIGNRIHEALAFYYTPGNTEEETKEWLEKSIQTDRDKLSTLDLISFDKDINLIRIMLDGYFQWLEEEGIDEDLEIVETESEIEAEICVRGTPVIIQGKRDAIGFDRRTGISALIDHKTVSNFDDTMCDLNEQSRMYLLLQRLNGSTVVQNCFWNMLRRVLRSAKAKPPFYKREFFYISEEELRNFWTRLHGEIQDIINVRARLDGGESHRSACYPRPSRDCSWKCSFRIACPLMDQGDVFEEYLVNSYSIGDPYKRYNDKKGEI